MERVVSNGEFDHHTAPSVSSSKRILSIVKFQVKSGSRERASRFSMFVRAFGARASPPWKVNSLVLFVCLLAYSSRTCAKAVQRVA
jgi:hypothetical protein